MRTGNILLLNHCSSWCVKNINHLIFNKYATLTFHGKAKGKLINDLCVTPHTIINQEMFALTTTNPELTKALNSFTVTASIHTCVTKVYSPPLFEQHSGVLPCSGIFAQVLLICLLSVMIR